MFDRSTPLARARAPGTPGPPGCDRPGLHSPLASSPLPAAPLPPYFRLNAIHQNPSTTSLISVTSTRSPRLSTPFEGWLNQPEGP